MKDASRRVLAYGASLAVVSGLVYGGFVYQSEPDLMTALSSADVQLRLASQLPAKGEDGKPFEPRVELLRGVKRLLESAERTSPGAPLTREYTAYVAFLEERFLDAAALYEEQRGLEGCTPEMRSQSVINQARMLRIEGRPTDAGRVLEEHLDTLEKPFIEAARAELESIKRTVAKRSDGPAASLDSRQ